jgi:hypothetical protein
MCTRPVQSVEPSVAFNLLLLFSTCWKAYGGQANLVEEEEEEEEHSSLKLLSVMREPQLSFLL